MRHLLYLLIFWGVGNICVGQPQITTIRYWFDQSPSTTLQSVVPGIGGSLDIDLDALALPEGSHTLHVQFMDANGVWSAPFSRQFFRFSLGANSFQKAEYWIDDDFPSRTTIQFNQNPGLIIMDRDIPLVGYAPGLHYLRTRFQDDAGIWSAIHSQPVYYPGQPINIQGYYYWVNEGSESFVAVQANQSPLVLIDQLPVTGMGGIDTVFIQFLDQGGIRSSVYAMPFTGSGNFQPQIAGEVLDIGFDSQAGNLSRTPIEGATVELRLGNSVAQTTTTDVLGQFAFAGITLQDYSLKVSYLQGGQNYERIVDPVDFTQSNSISLPITLSNQTTSIYPQLSSIDIQINELGISKPIVGYDISLLNDFVTGTYTLDSEAEKEIAALGRLLVLELAMRDYLGQASMLTESRQLAIRDFIVTLAALINVWDLIADLGLNNLPVQEQQILKPLLTHKIKLVNRLIRKGTELMLSHLPQSQEGQKIRAAILQTVDIVTKVFEGQSFEVLAYAIANDKAVKSGIPQTLQNEFIDPTQPFLDQAIDYGATIGPQGSFSAAYERSVIQRAEALQSTIDRIQWAEGLRTSADVASSIEDLNDIFEDLKGLGKLSSLKLSHLNTIGAFLKGIQLVSLPGAIRHSQIGLEATKAPVQYASTDVFFRTPAAAAFGFFEAAEINSNRTETDSIVERWLENLAEISSAIQANQHTIAFQKIRDHIEIDSLFSVSIDACLAPIIAANYTYGDSVPQSGFTFGSRIGGPIMEMDELRNEALRYCIQYVLDSVQVPYADSISALGDSLDLLWQSQIPVIDSMLDRVPFTPTPAYIRLDEINIPDTLAPGTSQNCQLVFTNIGAVNTQNLMLTIETEQGLSSNLGQLPLEEMAPGERDSVNFILSAAMVDSIGLYSVLFSSQNTTANGLGGAIRIGNPVFTSLIPAFHSSQKLVLYPNPAQDKVRLEFPAEAGSNIIHEVLDLKGRVIESRQMEVRQEGAQNWDYAVQHLPSGMYLHVIKTGKEIFTGKMIVK